MLAVYDFAKSFLSTKGLALQNIVLISFNSFICLFIQISSSSIGLSFQQVQLADLKVVRYMFTSLPAKRLNWLSMQAVK